MMKFKSLLLVSSLLFAASCIKTGGGPDKPETGGPDIPVQPIPAAGLSMTVKNSAAFGQCASSIAGEVVISNESDQPTTWKIEKALGSGLRYEPASGSIAGKGIVTVRVTGLLAETDIDRKTGKTAIALTLFSGVHKQEKRVEEPLQGALLKLTPDTIDFGMVTQGESDTKEIVIANQSSKATTLAFGNLLNSVFSVDPDHVSLEPGTSRKVALTFHPQTLGSKSLDMAVTSDVPACVLSQQQVLLKGQGTQNFTADVAQLDWSQSCSETDGEAKSLNFSRRKSGQSRIQGKVLQGPFAIVSIKEFGQDGTVVVRFNRNNLRPNTYQGSLELFDADNNETIQINLKGEVFGANIELGTDGPEGFEPFDLTRLVPWTVETSQSFETNPKAFEAPLVFNNTGNRPIGVWIKVPTKDTMVGHNAIMTLPVGRSVFKMPISTGVAGSWENQVILDYMPTEKAGYCNSRMQTQYLGMRYAVIPDLDVEGTAGDSSYSCGSIGDESFELKIKNKATRAIFVRGRSLTNKSRSIILDGIALPVVQGIEPGESASFSIKVKDRQAFERSFKPGDVLSFVYEVSPQAGDFSHFLTGSLDFEPHVNGAFVGFEDKSIEFGGAFGNMGLQRKVGVRNWGPDTVPMKIAVSESSGIGRFSVESAAAVDMPPGLNYVDLQYTGDSIKTGIGEGKLSLSDVSGKVCLVSGHPLPLTAHTLLGAIAFDQSSLALKKVPNKNSCDEAPVAAATRLKNDNAVAVRYALRVEPAGLLEILVDGVSVEGSHVQTLGPKSFQSIEVRLKRDMDAISQAEFRELVSQDELARLTVTFENSTDTMQIPVNWGTTRFAPAVELLDFGLVNRWGVSKVIAINSYGTEFEPIDLQLNGPSDLDDMTVTPYSSIFKSFRATAWPKFSATAAKRLGHLVSFTAKPSQSNVCPLRKNFEVWVQAEAAIEQLSWSFVDDGSDMQSGFKTACGTKSAARILKVRNLGNSALKVNQLQFNKAGPDALFSSRIINPLRIMHPGEYLEIEVEPLKAMRQDFQKGPLDDYQSLRDDLVLSVEWLDSHRMDEQKFLVRDAPYGFFLDKTTREAGITTDKDFKLRMLVVPRSSFGHINFNQWQITSSSGQDLKWTVSSETSRDISLSWTPAPGITKATITMKNESYTNCTVNSFEVRLPAQ